jgi:lipopolysaccharide transport system ATP-binding protein
MTLAISFEEVSKRYRLGEVGTGTISRDLERALARFRGKPDPHETIGVENRRDIAGGEFVWALKDISFDVAEGEVLGIIGRNGAGKSTLLKLLSGVTLPTRGTIRSKGRIASLLEVGTGFHPDLTGRENVHLNGAILGMTRHEVNSHFDEIVEFSGCAKYIDTPVKRYSSGMLVRLGFAVAAHLSCEVLIVDEVLAVGDAEFQRRCIGRMEEVASQQGRTIVFVSHNMVAVENLCRRCVVFDNGQLLDSGSTSAMIETYERLTREIQRTPISDRQDRSGSGVSRVIGIECHSSDSDANMIRSGCELTIQITLDVQKAARTDIHVGLRDSQGVSVAHLAITTATGSEIKLSPGVQQVKFVVPNLPLAQGDFSMNLYVTSDGEVADWVKDALTLQVASGDFFGTGKLPPADLTRVLIAHKIV